MIQLLNSKLDLLSEYSISFLRILCDYAAIAIQNARSMTLIQELTITDDVTGLFNARHLYTMLDERVASREEFSLLFVDLDHFKAVNDTHGHLVGSRLLAEVGGLMKRSLGPTCAAFRYGGDEFVALMPGGGKAKGIESTMELRDDLRSARYLEGAGLSLRISGSFGMATYPEDGETVATILRSADTMMYEAKNATRDNVAVAGRGILLEMDRASRRGEGAGREIVSLRRTIRLISNYMFECGGALAGLGLDGVAILGGDGVDAEVPDAEVDVAVGEDLHEGVFAEVEEFAGGDLHPVAAGEKFGFDFGDVGLGAAAA